MNRERSLRATGIVMLVATVALALTSVVGRARLVGVPGLDALGMFPLPLLGGLLVWKKPRHPIGWIMLGLGTAVAIAGASNFVLEEHGTSGEEAGTAQVLNHIGFACMVGLFALLLTLFPTGKVPSSRWRSLPWVAVSASVLIAISGVFGTPDDDSEAVSPFAIEGAQTVLAFVGGVGLVSAFVAIVLGGVSVLWRSRTGSHTERMQIKWFALSVGVLVALMLVSLTPLFSGQPWADRLFDAVLVIITGAVMPLCIAIAVLKHRLYDIDLVVNRALVYGGLTSILGASYLLIVVLLQRLLEPVTVESDLSVAASTLAVAALFRPARSRIQRFIDHRFYRRKYDAAQTLTGFSARLRDQVDLDALASELVAVVGTTMQPAHANLWLRQPAEAVADAGTSA